MTKMSDKDEIIDLGAAVIAIIQSPPGTLIDDEGLTWRWNGMGLQQGRLGDWADRETSELARYLPLRRVRYGWVKCEREEAFELPDGSRAFMRKLWGNSDSPAFSVGMMPWHVREGGHWVKWGRL